MQSLLILGRQPAIGMAELESLYGAEKLRPVGNQAVIVDVDPCLLAFDRLGGSVKFCKLLTELDTVSWEEIEEFLIQASPEHSKSMPVGKMLLGISTYGFNITPKQVQKTAISIKQAVRQTGRSVRVVPNNNNELSSAQVIHNRLTSANGWELTIIKDKEKTTIAQTVKVQDIAAYSKRDRNRPFRDPKVGMLPPKLAQVIINLGVGLLPPEAIQSVCEIPPDQPIPKEHFKGALLLDPFCGTGVVLQEAMIMGYDVYGSDIDSRMIDYSRQNINWLKNLPRSPLSNDVTFELKIADATRHNWSIEPTVIVSETSLGKPISKIPSEVPAPIINQCNQVISQFLTNIGEQISRGTRLCLAVPAWQLSNGNFQHLPLLDSLGVIGYNLVSFQHPGVDRLIYFRPDQAVARELLVLTRK